MLTSGTLAGLQEALASWIARDSSKNGHYISSRVPKMAAYGAFISAPLGHLLISILQRMFSGRTSLRAKILQILFSNLIVRSCQINDHSIQRVLMCPIDLPNSECRVPIVYGTHRRRTNVPSGPGHSSGGLLSSDESKLDCVSALVGLCAKIST